jgi:hypothetical protein
MDLSQHLAAFAALQDRPDRRVWSHPGHQDRWAVDYADVVAEQLRVAQHE